MVALPALPGVAVAGVEFPVDGGVSTLSIVGDGVFRFSGILRGARFGRVCRGCLLAFVVVDLRSEKYK